MKYFEKFIFQRDFQRDGSEGLIAEVLFKDYSQFKRFENELISYSAYESVDNVRFTEKFYSFSKGSWCYSLKTVYLEKLLFSFEKIESSDGQVFLRIFSFCKEADDILLWIFKVLGEM